MEISAEELNDMIGKIDYEGGLAEILFHYAGPDFFNIDSDLHSAAKKAHESFEDFMAIWLDMCAGV